MMTDGRAAASSAMTPGQSGKRQVVGGLRNDRHACLGGAGGRSVSHGAGVIVVGRDDRQPNTRRRRLEPWRKLARRKGRRVGAEVRTAGADPEDEP